MRPILDPRNGDIEDDASSTKRRSLISLAGSLLARDQSFEVRHRLDASDRLPGSAAWSVAACCIDLDRRRLVQSYQYLHRNLAGVAAAALSWRLAGSRAGHSCGMAENSFWSHERPGRPTRLHRVS